MLYKLPKVLRIEPASQCNLRCLHCPTGTMSMSRNVMSNNVEEEVLKNIEKNSKFFKVCVLYHGGEPLLNYNFVKLLEKIRAILKHAKIKTVSNGMLLNKKKSIELANSGLDEIEFSLDAQSINESNLIRRNSNARMIIEKIKELLKIVKSENSKLKIRLSTSQFLNPELKINPLETNPLPPKWLEDELPKIDIIKTCWAMKWPHYNTPEIFQELTIDSKSVDYCDHVENTITVRSNGDVVPCCYDLTSQLVMGNITENSLEEIWNGSLYNNLREEIKKKDYNPTCSNCNVVANRKVFLSLNKSFKNTN